MAPENTPCRAPTASRVIKETGRTAAVAVLLGPTAIGKSVSALQLARETGWDIVSCDSRQIYTGMDIGTAKPTLEERSIVHHWLIDILDPAEMYSACRFAETAASVIRERALAGKRVLIVGGTGLYFRALSEGLAEMVESEPQVKQLLMLEAASSGTETLYRELAAVDPPAAARIHANDLQRIVRALAVYRQTGRPMSSQAAASHPPADMRFIIAKMSMPRLQLYERINARVDAMVNAGLQREFLSLLEAGYDRTAPGMQSVGYRELFDVIDGTCSFETAVELIKRNSRRYAKRQTTWFSHQVGGKTFDAGTTWTALLEYFRENGMDV